MMKHRFLFRVLMSVIGVLAAAGAAVMPVVSRAAVVAAPCAPPVLSVGLVASNTMVGLAWKGCPLNDYQVEQSRTLLNWSAYSPPLGVAAPGGPMGWTGAVDGAVQYFRLATRVLTNSPIPTVPGLHGDLWMTHGGINRRFRLHVPPGYTGTASVPLALILHGHNQSGDEFAANQPALTRYAASMGVILVFPDAVDGVNGRGWNSQGVSAENPVDDVGFLRALIERLAASLAIDRERIYAGGFSNGGQMVHHLGAATTNVFAAFASVGSAIAGGVGGGSLIYQPPPSQPMPILIVNATNDCKRPFWGGVNMDGLLQPAAFEAVAHWTNANLCTASPVVTTNWIATNHVLRAFADTCGGPYPPPNVTVTNVVVREHHQIGCAPGSEVLFVTLSDGGHKWPDADDHVGFDASLEALEFFLRHCRCGAAGAPAGGSAVIPTAPGRYELQLCDQGYRRSFLLQVPTNYNPVVATPVVFAFHGGGQTAPGFAVEHPALFAKAEFENVLLVLPQALEHPMTGGTLWMNKPFDFVSDDRRFLTNLIATLGAKLHLDRARIYLTGFSSGGAFAHWFAATQPGVVAAIAPVCTQTGWNDPVTGAPVAPPPALEPMAVMLVRGALDPQRPFGGGLNIDGVVCRSAADDTAYWTAAGGCLPGPTVTGTPYGGTVRYPNCAGTTEVVLVRVDTMPHVWPDLADGFGFDANVATIDFLLRHSR